MACGGGIIVASYAEQMTKVPYEQMMAEKLFKPLKMNRARFGTPASPGSKTSADGPWEHVLQNGKVTPVAPDPAQSAQTRSPVGRNICCSVADFGRFAAVHLQGARGKSKFLKPDTFKNIHTAVLSGHAPGWMVATVSWAKGTILWHNGTNLRNYALCHIVPQENYAICVMTNYYDDKVGAACDEVTHLLARRIKEGKFR